MTLKEKSREMALSEETLRKYMEDPDVLPSIVLLQSVIINHVKTKKFLREFLDINDTKKLEEIKIKADELTKEIILGIKPEIHPSDWVWDSIFISGSHCNNNQIIN